MGSPLARPGFRKSAMTPIATPLPFGLTRLDQSLQAKAMILSARSALDLAEAELAALQLARAFDEHPRLRSVDIVEINHRVSPFQNRASPERSHKALSHIDGAANAEAETSSLDHNESEALTDAVVERVECRAIRKAGARWLVWVGDQRLESLSGKTFHRPPAEADGVALAMAFILSEEEFAHWQAQALDVKTAPKNARPSQSL